MDMNIHDMPKEVYREAKVQACREGVTLKEFVVRALSNELKKTAKAEKK